MRQLSIFLILSGLLLTACGGTPTPDIEATVQAAVRATQTAQPTKAPTPDIEATVQAAVGATQTAQPTNTPAPTQTPPPTETPEPTDTPVPTDIPAPTATPTPAFVLHIVQDGETLFQIARQYGVSVETLMDANNITDRSLVQAGQELAIPSPDATVSEPEPTETNAPIGEAEPGLDDQETVVSPTQPAATSTPLPADTPLEELPDSDKISILEMALRSSGAVVVKDVMFGGETGRETILVVIETQGGQGSVTDETTLVEASTPFIYAYEASQRMKLEAQFVLVRAQDQAGEDTWYALARMNDIGRLVRGEITAFEFVGRMVLEKP